MSFPQPPAPPGADDSLAYLGELADFITDGDDVVKAARTLRRETVARLRAAGVPAVRIAEAARVNDSYITRLARGETH